VPGPGELDLDGLLELDPGPRTRGKAVFLDTIELQDVTKIIAEQPD
jgi:hypothetical protein